MRAPVALFRQIECEAPSRRKLTAKDGWYVARVEEFPEVLTGAPTRDEARPMALDALREYLASCAETGTAPVTRGPAAPRT